MVREVGAAVLGDLDTKEALPLLASMLDDGEPRVRRRAAQALGRRAHAEPRALSALRTRVADGDPGVAVAARAALLLAGEKDQEPALRLACKHTDPDVRRSLAVSLARPLSTGSPPGPERELLGILLADEDPAVRLAAGRGLYLFGDPRAAAVLREATIGNRAEAVIAYRLLASQPQGASPAGKGAMPIEPPLLRAPERASFADRMLLLDALSDEAVLMAPSWGSAVKSASVHDVTLLYRLLFHRSAESALVRARAAAVLSRLLGGGKPAGAAGLLLRFGQMLQ
jgi:HEAT repeat protein